MCAVDRSEKKILFFQSPAGGIIDVSRVGVHGHWVHGEVRDEKWLPVFEAAATSDFLRYSKQSYTKKKEEKKKAACDDGHHR